MLKSRERIVSGIGAMGDGVLTTLIYYRYPPEHWIKLKTNNPMERVLWEARRRTKVVGAFPNGQ